MTTREDILNLDFQVREDRVQSGRYFVVGSTGNNGPLATICLISTNYPETNKLLAELITEALKGLQNDRTS